MQDHYKISKTLVTIAAAITLAMLVAFTLSALLIHLDDAKYFNTWYLPPILISFLLFPAVIALSIVGIVHGAKAINSGNKKGKKTITLGIVTITVAAVTELVFVFFRTIVYGMSV